jgi:hypothetical protein
VACSGTAVYIYNGLKEDDLYPVLLNFILEKYAIRKVKKTKIGIEWNPSASGVC